MLNCWFRFFKIIFQQICDDLMDYKVLSEFQVREFVASDGTRPFSNAPETQYSAVTVKFFV